MFADGTDDRWLAETLLDNGPEPLWPAALMQGRADRASQHHWAPEAGDIEAMLPDPYGMANPPPVRAYFFPGRTGRRALVIGGIHGTEQQGSDVVEMLRQLLHTRSAAGNPPYFTTILVPTLFASTHRGGARAGERYVSGGMGYDTSGKLERSRQVEPNRNYPLPGEDLADARARGAGSPTDPELVFRDTAGRVRAPRDRSVPQPGGRSRTYGYTSTRMLPETRILIALIERFQPERLATVHAHSLQSTIGDAPGIFVDPRGIDPTTGAVANQAQVDEDDRLATAMVTEGTRRWRAPANVRKGGGAHRQRAPSDPFVGNAAGTAAGSVRYTSTAHSEGNSLGTWAPVPTRSRPGMATVTVEVPQWQGAANQPALAQIEELHRDLLCEIFLGDPAAVTAPTQPTRPTTIPAAGR